MPKAMRTSEPVRIGVPTSKPNSVSLSPSSSLMRTPMMEKIVHAAKQTVKAIVDIRRALAGVLSRRSAAACPALMFTRLRLHGPNKKPPDRSRQPAVAGCKDLIGGIAGRCPPLDTHIHGPTASRNTKQE